jgi:hypothetical protein
MLLFPDTVTHLIIPAFRRLRQEEHKFEANLGFIARPCLKKRKKKRGE